MKLGQVFERSLSANLSFLSGTKVTGKGSGPERREGEAMGVEQFIWLGDHRAELTGQIEIVWDNEEIVSIGLEVLSPDDRTDGNKEGRWWVYTDKIKIRMEVNEMATPKKPPRYGPDADPW